jgi:hypothetical protein
MPLTASQRVTLITGIAAELDRENRSHIVAILHQFGVETETEDRIDNDKAYILAMIKDSPDETLLALGEHFGVFVAGKPVVPTPAFWERGCLRLFISHINKHRRFAGRLQSALMNYGITAFVAHKDIAPTKAWENEIIAALETCHALIALMHPTFHASSWTDQEIGYAMGRGVAVCSVMIGEKPYGFINRYQAFSSEGNDEDIPVLAMEIFEAYKTNPQTQGLLTEAVVQMFEKCPSFARAREIKDLLKRLPRLDPTHGSRLRKTLISNHQVYDAFGVPEAVKAIIKRLKH